MQAQNTSSAEQGNASDNDGKESIKDSEEHAGLKSRLDSLPLKQLDLYCKELISILELNSKYVPNAPTLSDVNRVKNKSINGDNNNRYCMQKQGNGSGNTKNDKKRMKKQHSQLLKMWINVLEKEVLKNQLQLPKQQNYKSKKKRKQTRQKGKLRVSQK